MPARTQWNVFRRVSPLMEGVIPALRAALNASSAPAGDTGGTDLEALGMACLPALTGVMSRLSDADSDYVINTCLAVVQRPNPAGKYVNMTTRTGQFMFEQDDDLTLTLVLTVHVLKENLAGFLGELRGLFGAPPEPPTPS